MRWDFITPSVHGCLRAASVGFSRRASGFQQLTLVAYLFLSRLGHGWILYWSRTPKGEEAIDIIWCGSLCRDMHPVRRLILDLCLEELASLPDECLV